MRGLNLKVSTHIADVEYDRNYHCKEKGCREICRCGTISNVRIQSIDINSIFESINIHPYKESDINSYCIDRLLSIFRVYDCEKWECEVCHGYYGEEIDYIYFSDCLNFNKALKKVLSLSSLREKVLFLLEKEYGYVLPDIEKYEEVSIQKVEIRNINMGSQYRKISVENQEIDYYDEENGIFGVCIGRDNDYRLIDGYTRIVNIKRECPEKRIVNMIVFS
jgi:hypothetical protein